jgi:hypothetical protein
VANRSKDWLAQAVRDLEQARSSRSEERHEWACFAAQQAAEKAVKALHLALGQKAYGIGSCGRQSVSPEPWKEILCGFLTRDNKRRDLIAAHGCQRRSKGHNPSPHFPTGVYRIVGP